MSLFTKLLKLHSGNKPREDFFTEIFAHFLSLNHDILIFLLKSRSIIHEDNYFNIRISTQEQYKGLPDHTEDSRIDIVVDLLKGISRDLIFIESKIDAKDGNNNLEKYAQILSKIPNVRHRILIYITRDYDPKEEIKTYTSNLSPPVSFYELRWYQLYDVLNKYDPDILHMEILKFMEENRMFRNNQFSPIDLLTIGNFSRTIQLMNDTLDGDVKSTFTKIFPTKKYQRLTDWKNDQYTIYKELSGDQFQCQLGYFNLKKTNGTEYPDLGVAVGVSYKYENFPSCLKSMKDIHNDKPNEWNEPIGYDSDKWMAIFYTKSLQEFLSAKDHVSAIQEHFLDCIREIQDIQNNYFNFIKSDKEPEITNEEVIAED